MSLGEKSCKLLRCWPCRHYFISQSGEKLKLRAEPSRQQIDGNADRSSRATRARNTTLTASDLFRCVPFCVAIISVPATRVALEATRIGGRVRCMAASVRPPLRPRVYVVAWWDLVRGKKESKRHGPDGWTGGSIDALSGPVLDAYLSKACIT